MMIGTSRHGAWWEAGPRPLVRRTARRLSPMLILAVLMLALLGGACSPEASRVPGEPGADVGNRTYPLPPLHGDRSRNNPSAEVPRVGKAPPDARGVPGYWAQQGQRP